MKEPGAFGEIPAEWVVESPDALSLGDRVGCMQWVRNEPGWSIWTPVDGVAICCVWVNDGLVRMKLNIPHGQELRLRAGQGLSPC